MQTPLAASGVFYCLTIKGFAPSVNSSLPFETVLVVDVKNFG